MTKLRKHPRRPLRVEDLDTRAGACSRCHGLYRRLHHGLCLDCRSEIGGEMAEALAHRVGTEKMLFEEA
jgi:hypothetical protein